MNIVVWLRSLGLGQYEAAFRDNEIDETVLPNLTAEDLKDLGVSVVGHRRKLLDAIAALRTDADARVPSDGATTSSGPAGSPEDRAERRQVTVMFSDLVGSTALSARMDPDTRQMSAFGGKADMASDNPMSAFDPKRTSALCCAALRRSCPCARVLPPA
jgi:hypothetical protein